MPTPIYNQGKGGTERATPGPSSQTQGQPSQALMTAGQYLCPKRKEINSKKGRRTENRKAVCLFRQTLCQSTPSSPHSLKCHCLLSSVRKVSRAILHPYESVSRSRRMFSTIRYMTLSSTLGLRKGHRGVQGSSRLAETPRDGLGGGGNPAQWNERLLLVWVPLGLRHRVVHHGPPAPHGRPAPLTGALCCPQWRRLVSEEHCCRPGCCCHRRRERTRARQSPLLTVSPLTTRANTSTLALQKSMIKEPIELLCRLIKPLSVVTGARAGSVMVTPLVIPTVPSTVLDRKQMLSNT